MITDPAILDAFFEECDDLLTALADGLSDMRAGQTDSETVNAVFRAVHSIKGAAGAFSMDELVEFAHGQLTEDAVLCAQDLDLISQIITELRGLLNRIASQTPENLQVSLDDVLHPVRLERLRQTLLSGPSAPQEQPCQQPDAIHLFD